MSFGGTEGKVRSRRENGQCGCNLYKPLFKARLRESRREAGSNIVSKLVEG